MRYKDDAENNKNVPKHSIDSLINYWYAKREWDDRMRAKVNSYLLSMFRIRFMRDVATQLYFDYVVSPGLGIALGPVIYKPSGLAQIGGIFSDHAQIEILIAGATTGSGWDYFNKIVNDELLPRYPAFNILHAGGYSVGPSMIGTFPAVQNTWYNAGYTYEATFAGGKVTLFTYTGLWNLIENTIKTEESRPVKVAYLPEKPIDTGGTAKGGIGFPHEAGFNLFQYSGWFFYGPQMMTIAKDLTARVWMDLGTEAVVILQFDRMNKDPMGGFMSTRKVDLLVYPLVGTDVYNNPDELDPALLKAAGDLLPGYYLGKPTTVYEESRNAKVLWEEPPWEDWLGLSNIKSEEALKGMISGAVMNAARTLAGLGPPKMTDGGPPEYMYQ